MIDIVFYSEKEQPTGDVQESVTDFLYTHLEQYGDPREDIQKAIVYASCKSEITGGHVIVARNGNEIIGAVVINNTRMEGYIPENILVYIAVHPDYRGKGLGKKLLSEVIGRVPGDIALHVEPDNPAFFLYQSLGFANKYLEMRYTRKDKN